MGEENMLELKSGSFTTKFSSAEVEDLIQLSYDISTELIGSGLSVKYKINIINNSHSRVNVDVHYYDEDEYEIDKSRLVTLMKPGEQKLKEKNFLTKKDAVKYYDIKASLQPL